MQAVILAAGDSSRFWPLSASRHKALFKIRGKPLIQHTLESLEDFRSEEVIIVQSPDRKIEEALEGEDVDLDLKFVVQEESRGMGNALEQASDLLKKNFFVLTPYRSNAGVLMEEMFDMFIDTDADAVLLSKKTDKPWKYGILELDGEEAVGLEEKPAKGQAKSNNRVVGMYLLSREIFTYLDDVEEHEYQFEDALDRYIEDNDVRVTKTGRATSSIKYPWGLFQVTQELFDEMERDISSEAEIADSATIEGEVVVGPGTKIYENAVVRGPCYIGRDCVIGNNAVVRAHSNLENKVVVGANSEIRGSLVQENTHTHQAFIGDTLIGRNTRIGAGTVFANRNVRKDGGRSTIRVHLERKDETVDSGRERLGGIVGDHVDIGTQANIMPGVELGPNSFVGPSTCVFKNVGGGEKVYTKFDNARKQR